MRRLVLSAVAALLFVPATLTAQKASYTYVGTGARTCKASLTLVAVGLPKIGSKTFGIQVYASWGIPSDYAIGWLLTGFSNKKFGGLTLPFDISVVGPSFEGLLRNSIEIVQPGPPGQRNTLVTIPFPIPNDQSLLGLSFYQQVLLQSSTTVRPGCWLYSLSRGGHGVIGT